MSIFISIVNLVVTNFLYFLAGIAWFSVLRISFLNPNRIHRAIEYWLLGLAFGTLTTWLFSISFAGQLSPIPILLAAISGAFRVYSSLSSNSEDLTNDLEVRPNYKKASLVTFFIICAYICVKACWDPIYGVGGVLAWGYKIKLFSISSHIPIDYFTSEYYSTSHQNYPLGFPLALWPHTIGVGSFSERLIKIFPPICLGLTAIFLTESRKNVAVFAVITLVLLLLSPEIIYIVQHLYADPLYILFGVVSIFRISSDVLDEKKMGVWLCCASCWIKQEGIILVIAAIISLALSSGSRKILLQFIIPASVFIIPWKIFCIYLGMGYDDFSIQQIMHIEWWKELLERASIIINGITKHLLWPPWKFNGLWWLLIALVIYSLIIRIQEKSKTIDPVAQYRFRCASLYFLGLIIIFLFSKQPLEWHIYASAGRIFILPLTILIWELTTILANKLSPDLKLLTRAENR